MVITTHVCRGNFRSTWISSGGYEPVAERLLGAVQLRRLFPGIRQRARRRLRAAALPAEGQEDRRGRRHHLEERHLGEQGRPSSAGSTRRRSSRRSSSSALSPQCGFASTEEGNVLTEEQQWAKMREVVEIADEVWGK